MVTGEIIPYPLGISGPNTGLKLRIDGLIAIFRAIDAGELLAALPECDTARAQHSTALTLLALAERELHILRNAIEE